MGVGFFLGILQPGNSLQLSRDRAAASRFHPRLCPESGRLYLRRAPGTLRPTHAENQLRAIAGPGLSPQHTRSLDSDGPLRTPHSSATVPTRRKCSRRGYRAPRRRAQTSQ